MVKQIVIAALCLTSVGAVAEQAPPARTPRPAERGADGQARTAAPEDDSLSVAELTAALDAYALVQAQQQLSIGDDKYDTFAARLKRLQDVRRRSQRVRLRLLQDLRRMAGARAAVQADDAAIKTALTALRDHDDRSAAELRQAYDALDQVLDVRQQARFRLFEEVIEQRKLELLVRAQERARQRRKPPG